MQLFEKQTFKILLYFDCMHFLSDLKVTKMIPKASKFQHVLQVDPIFITQYTI